MISSQFSHLAQSPCMRLGASMGSGVVAIRGFLENQAMKGALIALPRARQPVQEVAGLGSRSPPGAWTWACATPPDTTSLPVRQSPSIASWTQLALRPEALEP